MKPGSLGPWPMLYMYNLSLVKETVLCLLWIMQSVCSPHCLKPLGAPSSFLHPVKFLVLIFMPLYSLKLPYISAIISYKPPGMLQAHKTSPCSLLLESWVLLLPVPPSLHAPFLIATTFLLSKSQVTSLHSTPSLRCSYTTSFRIMLLPWVN